MKNLLVYINPTKRFNANCRYNYDQMARLQIDNSLDLGWSKKDIVLVTNFKYEYNGIKSIVVGDDLYTEFDKTSAKIPVIDYLLCNDMLENELYWYHDFDAYQDAEIKEEDLELDTVDLGLTMYGYNGYWNCGVFFFKLNSKDIFELFASEIFRKRIPTRCDEKVLHRLTVSEVISADRYKTLNPTYNFNYKYTYITYPLATKPLKVLHFNPSEIPRGSCSRLMDYTNLDAFMYGNNLTGKPFMSERLIRIFREHDIK